MEKIIGICSYFILVLVLVTVFIVLVYNAVMVQRENAVNYYKYNEKYHNSTVIQK